MDTGIYIDSSTIASEHVAHTAAALVALFEAGHTYRVAEGVMHAAIDTLRAAASPPVTNFTDCSVVGEKTINCTEGR